MGDLLERMRQYPMDANTAFLLVGEAERELSAARKALEDGWVRVAQSGIVHYAALLERARPFIASACHAAEGRLDNENEPEPYFTLRTLLEEIDAALSGISKPRP